MKKIQKNNTIISKSEIEELINLINATEFFKREEKVLKEIQAFNPKENGLLEDFGEQCELYLDNTDKMYTFHNNSPIKVINLVSLDNKLYMPVQKPTAKFEGERIVVFGKADSEYKDIASTDKVSYAPVEETMFIAIYTENDCSPYYIHKIKNKKALCIMSW